MFVKALNPRNHAGLVYKLFVMIFFQIFLIIFLEVGAKFINTWTKKIVIGRIFKHIFKINAKFANPWSQKVGIGRFVLHIFSLL
jgi:hypothetical protein